MICFERYRRRYYFQYYVLMEKYMFSSYDRLFNLTIFFFSSLFVYVFRYRTPMQYCAAKLCIYHVEVIHYFVVKY